MFETKTYLAHEAHAATFFAPWHKADELSYCAGRLEEVFFEANPEVHGRPLVDYALALAKRVFPTIATERIKAFSYQLADGVIYEHNKFMIMVDNAQVDCFSYPELFCFNPWPQYCLNHEISNRENVQKNTAKFYAMDLANEVKIKLPPSARFAQAYGVGVGANRDVRGIYITTRNYQELIDFFGLPDPLPEYVRDRDTENMKDHLFGLTYCVHENKPLRLVYYLTNGTNAEQQHAINTAITIG